MLAVQEDIGVGPDGVGDSPRSSVFVGLRFYERFKMDRRKRRMHKDRSSFCLISMA